MIGKLVAILFGVALFLFFLSVLAPMESQKPFWITIHKIRAGMDLVVYWFFNLCAIGSVLYLILTTVSKI